MAMRQFVEMSVKGVLDDKKHTDGRKIYRGVATTPALDRYGEVVLPKGAVLTNFLANPVLLEIHDYQKSSIGQVVNIEVREAEMIFDFVFSTDQRGSELEKKYADGDMRAFSIGFRPKGMIDLWSPWDDEPDVTEVKVALPDGTEQIIDVSKYEQVPYRIYNKWDLLEISPVAVPANPEALLMREAGEIVRRAIEENPMARSFVQEEVGSILGPAMKLLEEFQSKFADGFTLKGMGAVPTHSTPIVEAEKWSGSDARADLAKWASKDGSGDKEKMNWAKYRKGFAWFDSKTAESFASYLLPHHQVKDGELVAVWKGVTVAMAMLLGDRGGIEAEDKEKVYKHLARHYTDAGKDAPKFNKEYTGDELKALAEEPLTVEAEEKDIDGAGVPKNTDLDNSSDDTGVKGIELPTDAGEAPELILKLVSNLADRIEKMEISQSESMDSLVAITIKTTTLCDFLIDGGQSAPEKKKEKGEGDKETIVEGAEGLLKDLQDFVSRPLTKRTN
jgi:phage head maturation protease